MILSMSNRISTGSTVYPAEVDLGGVWEMRRGGYTE
jgi:hypothetical protein